ncbi:MAG: GGDEF domain-containing protein, partial [Ilumatobacter sp.]|nr:GGDEF domain-containing protein [Ilumatobacter sp.]
MIRAQRITSWLFVACAVVLVAVTSVVGSLPGSAWRVGVAVAAVVALVFAGRVNRMPILFLVAGTVGAARVITFPTGPIDDPVGALGMTETAANSLTGLALVTVLTLALRRRRGPLDQRDLIDALSVTISASLVSWILLASRLIAVHDVDPVVAISASVYLPIAIFLFTFIIDLLMAGLRSNRTMQIVTAAAGLNLVATVVADLGVVGLWSARADLSTAMFAATFLLFAASITHPDAPEIVRRASGRSPSDAYTPLRLSVTGACLMFPGVLLAAVDPVDGVDVAVRVVALIALVSTVLVRLLVAVHGQQETHDRMIERYQTDELTQLPTRRRFLDIVAEHLERTWRSEFQPTVIQMNLDRFKNINDSLGHDEANRVLQICGERLQAVAERFGSEIARLGGDDFALIDGNTTSLDESMERAEA